jgi:hypothetical protein
MACNSDQGGFINIKTSEDLKKAKELGYDKLFRVGDIVNIQGCFFKIFCFVLDKDLMTLKSISRKEAEVGLRKMQEDILAENALLTEGLPPNELKKEE